MIERLLENLKSFAAADASIQAVIVVGSFANGTGGPDSDVDLIIITSDTNRYLGDFAWVYQFGKALSGEHEDYELVQSVRVFYENGPEVEFGITTMDWIADKEFKSTGKILSGGYRVIYDPDNVIDQFYERAKSSGQL